MQPAYCKGFALTELLVAASLLAVGLLGHLAVLVVGLQLERDAANVATAATLVADLGERIRANRAAGLGYAIDPDAAPGSPTSGCALGAPADATARAACDLAEWQQEVASALPDAAVSLTAAAVSGSPAVLYTIEIRWSAWRDGAGARCSMQLQA